MIMKLIIVSLKRESGVAAFVLELTSHALVRVARSFGGALECR
jgi:hypothetical protein